MFNKNKDKISIKNDSVNEKIIVLRTNDKIEIVDDEIHISSSEKKYRISTNDLNKLAILTTDGGPFEDDVALTIATEEITIVIPSQHPLHEKFLFNDISKIITIDYQKIIDASSCAENAEFILYSK